jgi:DNA-binding IscR family transcriptional regulator
VIRTLLGKLKKAGIAGVRPGVGGAYLLRSADQITLPDIYLAVDLVEANQLFHFHHPEIKCEIGKLMETSLRKELAEVQQVMEQRLKQTTIRQLLDQRE